jgi:hypothetical protein
MDSFFPPESLLDPIDIKSKTCKSNRHSPGRYYSTPFSSLIRISSLNLSQPAINCGLEKYSGRLVAYGISCVAFFKGAPQASRKDGQILEDRFCSDGKR